SAVSIGAEAPLGIIAFNFLLHRTLPATSIKFLKLILCGRSYTLGLFTCPDTENRRVPPDLSVPILANFSAPSLIIKGTVAKVSTLLTQLGFPNAPTWAGKGGLSLGSPRLPSNEFKRAVSSPQI